jgi:hypothetical protein
VYAAQGRCILLLVGKGEGKKSLGRPIHRYSNIKIELKKKRDEMAWTGLIWLRTGTNGGLL